MRSGDFDRAWAITDRDVVAIRRAGGDKHEGPRHLQRIWRGEQLRSRRVLVRCYHGLGDTIQFARFLSPLAGLAGELIVWCQPELVSLIGGMEGVDVALPLHDGTPDVDFDVDIEIMEIPHAIRATLDQIRMSESYLAFASRGFKLPEPKELSVGLVWNVGDWDRRRVVPAVLLRQLDLPGLRLYSLQRGAASRTAGDIGAIDISVPDIEGLSERLLALDLCICPDTMVAHLAAALGRETWIMLHADCDWRWPASGRESLWYPSVRLFRQRRAGDWTDVVDGVRSELVARTVAAGGYPEAIESSEPTNAVAGERRAAVSRRPR
jgi:hypothetical protein